MIRNLSFQKTDGKMIHGRLYLPDSEKKCPIVIFSHGFGSDYRELEHYGPKFIQEGQAMLLFDFCGGGPRTTSDGSMGEMSVLTETEDLLTVIDAICDRKNPDMQGIDTDNIFLMGESQGGYVSALAASKLPDKIRGLILWYPSFVIEEVAKEELRTGHSITNDIFGIRVGKLYDEDAASVKIYKEVQKFERNVLIIHGTDDSIVPVAYSEKAHQIYKHADLYVVPGAGHGFEGPDCRKIGKLSAEFVKQNLWGIKPQMI